MRFDPYAADVPAYGHLHDLARHLGRSDLDPTIRVLVELRVSQISGCAFCLGFHVKGARRSGVDESKLDLLAGWHEAAVFTAQERAALGLAEEMARVGDGRRVSGPTWQAARQSFSDAELGALLHAVALIKAWNLLNVTTEFPAEGDLPVPTPGL